MPISHSDLVLRRINIARELSKNYAFKEAAVLAKKIVLIESYNLDKTVELGDIIMVPVRSSHLKYVGYDVESKNLYIIFWNDWVYMYANFHPEQYLEMMNVAIYGGSIGTYFWDEIRRYYDYIYKFKTNV